MKNLYSLNLDTLKGKRPSLRGLVIIVVVAGIGIASTQALFRDVERSQQGVFVVGTLDMNVENQSGQVAESITVNNIGQSRTLAGGKTWVINNVGSLPGELSFRLENISNQENGCNEPEALVDTSCGQPGVGEGELGAVIDTQVLVDDGSQVVTKVVATLSDADLTQYQDQWAVGDKVVVPAGGSVEVSFNWSSDTNTFANEVQSDSVTFDVVYELTQIITP